MLCTCVAAQSGESLSAECGVGQHAVYSDGHCLLGVLLHQLVIADFLEVADPAGVPSVNLLLQLLAGEDCLCAVNDDHMIAAVAVGSECRLVLASQNVSGWGGVTGPGWQLPGPGACLLRREYTSCAQLRQP
mgnify:CR=1 FL=1